MLMGGNGAGRFLIVVDIVEGIGGGLGYAIDARNLAGVLGIDMPNYPVYQARSLPIICTPRLRLWQQPATLLRPPRSLPPPITTRYCRTCLTA